MKLDPQYVDEYGFPVARITRSFGENGDDPATSVVDRNCRLHDVPNVFVIDTSFFPTGFGLNPMVTVVANALRVGTWIVESQSGGISWIKPTYILFCPVLCVGIQV